MGRRAKCDVPADLSPKERAKYLHKNREARFRLRQSEKIKALKAKVVDLQIAIVDDTFDEAVNKELTPTEGAQIAKLVMEAMLAPDNEIRSVKIQQAQEIISDLIVSKITKGGE